MCRPQRMTLHKLRATLPSAPVTVFPSKHSFFSDPLYWPAVCSFASSAFSDFPRVVLLQRKYACYRFSSMYFVEVTVSCRPSGSVLLVFSSGIQHVMLTAILTVSVTISSPVLNPAGRTTSSLEKAESPDPYKYLYPTVIHPCKIPCFPPDPFCIPLRMPQSQDLLLPHPLIPKFGFLFTITAMSGVRLFERLHYSSVRMLQFMRHVRWNAIYLHVRQNIFPTTVYLVINPLNAELNPICYLLALLAHHFLHVSRIRVKSLTLGLLMSYIYIYIWSTYS